MDKGWIRRIFIEEYDNKSRQGTGAFDEKSKICNLPRFGSCVASFLIVVSSPSWGLSFVKKYAVWNCLRTFSDSDRRRTHRRGVRGEGIRGCRLKYYVPTFSAISVRVLLFFLPSFFTFYLRLTVPLLGGLNSFVVNSTDFLSQSRRPCRSIALFFVRFSLLLRCTDSLPN
jgi:hypothetical protein